MINSPPAEQYDTEESSNKRTVRGALESAGAGLLGAAPHVLHHVGPLAGAALLAGATGKILFAVLGFVLIIPMMIKMHRISGGLDPVPALTR